jgi:putative transposase
MIQVQTYKYKLKPNVSQSKRLEQWLGTCRFLYNPGLELKIYAWEQRRKSISKYDLMKQLPELKKEADWIKDVPSQSLQSVFDRLDGSYQNFFKQGSGFPKFAKKDFYKSFTIKSGISIEDNQIKLPKIGKVRFHNSREITGTIKRATIVKEVDGWYICIMHESDVLPIKTGFKEIGIDLGISHFAVTTEGQFIENPGL